MSVVTHPRFASGLGANFDDSARHAFDHFEEARQILSRLIEARRDDEGNDVLLQLENQERHHCKWTTISVHHMAEILFSAMVYMFTKSDPRWLKADVRLPSLTRSTKQLLEDHRELLSSGEILLIEEAVGLVSARDQLVHRQLPPNLDPSKPAMLAIRLWRVGRRRFHDVQTASADWGLSGVFSDINEFVSYREMQTYLEKSASLLQELSPGLIFERCPECCQEAVDVGTCQVCFVEVESVDCPNEDCQFRNLIPAWVRGVDHGQEYLCDACGLDLGV